MRILVFATCNPGTSDGAAPFVVIPDGPNAFLPPHPDGLEWSYFVSTATGDALLMGWQAEAELALVTAGFFIFGRQVEPEPETSPAMEHH
jgi:hypothetical protein